MFYILLKCFKSLQRKQKSYIFSLKVGERPQHMKLNVINWFEDEAFWFARFLQIGRFFYNYNAQDYMAFHISASERVKVGEKLGLIKNWILQYTSAFCKNHQTFSAFLYFWTYTELKFCVETVETEQSGSISVRISSAFSFLILT